jgi:fructose-1-phosphate kinase PfkB-like protein
MAVLASAAGAANAMNWDIGHFRKDEVDSLLKKVEVRTL